ncbi:CobW family GTP-binding protein [Borborobacter arsenicus]|uniref:CobW family GTP-binding protein n=1 Tax=Borborobacter arsenicus TaxID=1851146 RepID=UPI001404A5B1|nr:CobW family GTP-binding protein [Pseudaminobacter arsenicus]
MTRIPLTIIGGFLGSGKTTLLNRMLRGSAGRRIAVLVNDFGDINIDAELITGHEGSTISLSNGCICCSIGDSLVEALVEVVRMTPPPEHIVIEASGVAEPQNIAEIARLDPGLRLSGILVMADAERVKELAGDKFVGDTVRHQLCAADMILLSKVDRVLEERKADLHAWLRNAIGVKRIVETVHGAVPMDVLFDTDFEEPGAGATVAHHDHHDHHAHDDQFETWAFVSDQEFDGGKLGELLGSLPAGVLRAKGFLRTQQKPGQTGILHLVGGHWEIAWHAAPAGTPAIRLVLIAVKGTLDREALQKRFACALAD